MAYTITSYDGWIFGDHDWHAALPYEAARGTFGIDGRSTQRPGNTPILSPGALTPNRLVVDFTLEPNAALDVLPAIDELLGVLDYRNSDPRLLVASRNGATVQRYARLDGAPSYPPSEAGNVVRVVFVSEDPEWVATTATTETDSGTVSPIELALTNAGQATVFPRYRIGWTAQHSANGTVVGQRYRKRMTLTNTQSRTLGQFPYRIDLGNTATLVTAGKLQADLDDLRIIVGGVDMPRLIQAPNKAQSFAWIVIPGMDAGETLTIDVVYGNASATNPPVWTDPDPTKPVIDLRWVTGTATGGSTTTVTVSGTPYEVNEWRRGYLYALTGANAGLFHTINSNTASQITVNTFPNAFVNTDTFLIVMSSNDRWSYAVRQTEREDEYARGRWYLDSPEHTPNEALTETPGAWRRELVYDNRDSMGQKRWTMLTTGGSDRDPFAILDAYRMVEGNDARVPEAGTSDGCSLVTPFPITELFWEYQFLNPNGVGIAMVNVRGSGAEEWATAFEDGAVTTSLTTLSAGVNPLDLSDYGDIHQIAMTLAPAGGIELDLDWKQDSGSATSGSTTTTNDSTKSWATDQFINARITMLSGANAGRTVQVTDSTASGLTHFAFPAANAAGDRYVVVNPKILRANLRDGGTLEIGMDDSVLTDSGLGAETAVYDAAMTLRVGPLSTESAGDHRALIGYAGGERRLFLAADEQVEIDAALRRIRIWDTGSSSYTSELTDPAVRVEFHDGDTWRRSANWLPLGTGAQSVWLSETNIGNLSLQVYYHAAWLGA